LSNATTPSVLELNDAWQQHIKKIEKLQTKTNKKILFTEFGYRNSDQAKNLGQKAKTINNHKSI
jgi:hypothetical protein